MRVTGDRDLVIRGDNAAAPLKHARVGEARPGPFRYLDKGKMATIGRTSAVVELPFGIRFGGFVAWIAWLALHLLWLVGFLASHWHHTVLSKSRGNFNVYCRK